MTLHNSHFAASFSHAESYFGDSVTVTLADGETSTTLSCVATPERIERRKNNSGGIDKVIVREVYVPASATNGKRLDSTITIDGATYSIDSAVAIAGDRLEVTAQRTLKSEVSRPGYRGDR